MRAPPWSARRERTATLLLAAPLAAVAVWAWAGAPALRLPAAAGVPGGAIVLLALTIAGALAVLRRARSTRAGDLAQCAMWWLAVAATAGTFGSRWARASAGAFFGVAAGRSLLDLLASLCA